MRATAAPGDMAEALIRTAGLVKEYLVGEQTVAALRGVSVTIDKGDFCLLYTSPSPRDS